VFLLIGSYLLLVFILPAALSLMVSYRSLHRGADCPTCRGDTIPLVAPRLKLVSRMSPFATLHRRWCLCCGWEGVTRLPRRAAAAATPAAAPGTGPDPATPEAAPGTGTDPATPAPPAPSPGAPRNALPGRRTAGTGRSRRRQGAEAPVSAGTQTLDVRSLDLNGTPWRVMLQCWRGSDLCYGRFVFIGPSGRLWLDAVESFSARTEYEVLGQALALPDDSLTERLRRLVVES
jgi:hypothetical protein